MPSNVPDALNGWEEEFVVPSQFSERTMTSISNDNPTSSARNETINSNDSCQNVELLKISYSNSSTYVTLWLLF